MDKVNYRGEEMPVWVKGIRKADKAILVDPDIAYPSFLEELGMKATQFSLEIARRCINLHLLELVGPGIIVNFSETHKKPEDRKWRLSNFTEGSNPGESAQTVPANIRTKYWEPLKKNRLLLKASKK